MVENELNLWIRKKAKILSIVGKSLCLAVLFPRNLMTYRFPRCEFMLNFYLTMNFVEMTTLPGYCLHSSARSCRISATLLVCPTFLVLSARNITDLLSSVQWYTPPVHWDTSFWEVRITGEFCRHCMPSQWSLVVKCLSSFISHVYQSPCDVPIDHSW